MNDDGLNESKLSESKSRESASGSSVSGLSALTGITLEVCVASLDAARIAQSAGADRIELNTALELDGLTPSAGLVKRVLGEIRIPVIAMARPRAGGFVYSDDEWETLKSDAAWLLENGVDGIAFGCLNANGNVDLDRCRQIRELAGDAEIVFHKAFDDVANWEAGLEVLVEAGVNRVMTSGQCPTAIEGLSVITALVRQSGGRIGILPAGRVSSKNAVQIVTESGCDQVHGSFSSGPQPNLASEVAEAIKQLGQVKP